MYEVISEVIGDTGANPEIIYYICAAVSVLLVVLIVDFIRDIFCGFFRG